MQSANQSIKSLIIKQLEAVNDTNLLDLIYKLLISES